MRLLAVALGLLLATATADRNATAAARLPTCRRVFAHIDGKQTGGEGCTCKRGVSARVARLLSHHRKSVLLLRTRRQSPPRYNTCSSRFTRVWPLLGHRESRSAGSHLLEAGMSRYGWGTVRGRFPGRIHQRVRREVQAHSGDAMRIRPAWVHGKAERRELSIRRVA